MAKNTIPKRIAYWLALPSVIAALFCCVYLDQDEKFEEFAEIKLKMSKEDVARITRSPNRREFVDVIDINGVNHGFTRYTWFSRVNNFSVDFDSEGRVQGKVYWSEPGSTFLEYLRRRYLR